MKDESENQFREKTRRTSSNKKNITRKKNE